MNQRKKLSDILRKSDQDNLQKAWNETNAAGEFAPLPAGEYIARVIGGECVTSKTNETPGYKVTFKVIEGEHAGRCIWHDMWLTQDAMQYTKRDLEKLGVTSFDQLDLPMRSFRCKVKLALRKMDDGKEYNRIHTFEVLGIDAPEVDPFAPKDEGGPKK